MDYSPWLIRRSERDFLKLILEYVSEIAGEVKILEAEVGCFLKNDFQKCKKKSQNLFTKSRNAIKSRKKLLRNLETGDITPDHRGYMANLIYAIADIAGYIDSASAKLNIKEILLNDTLKADIGEIMKKVSRMIDLLEESLQLLNVNLEDTIKKTDEISEIEEEIDYIRRNMIKTIVEETKNHPENLFILAEIVGSLEKISDKIDVAANKVEVIAMTHLP